MSGDRIAALRHAYDVRAQRLIELRDPPSLDREEFESWYLGPQDDDLFWPAIRSVLESLEWRPQDVQNLDDASSKVVARMSHPGSTSFSNRGLVLGHVQSGKTTNFTSVIAKAADAGYRFFIVLSGIHNGLREQTQQRLTDSLVQPNLEYWLPLTGPGRDFTAPDNATVYLAQVGEHHVLCVVKKNGPRLRRLLEWLRSAERRVLEDCPVLIIDDEADQAGVGTVTINGLIKSILDLLPKAAYVGYTATPFANLLIDPSAGDLYPKDFILDLPQPAEHFGTEVIFGRDAVEGEEGEGPLDGHDMVREVLVTELPVLRPAPRQPAEEFVPEITPSLRNAILYFWLSTAARRVRGTGPPHSTMLLHTSMRIAAHESFREPLENFRAEMVRLLASSDSTMLHELSTLWERETIRVPADDFGEQTVSFEELRGNLPEVVGETRIIMDNSRSRERLTYRPDQPVVAIAVGGNTLSRGLTLDGLIVSFFVRSASAYDTLLQMGRWFGYRHGYADLPRVWMTAELRRWFRHLATVEAEIRRDIQRYEEENLTPEDFAVRIRTHPSLAITAASKMRDAVRAFASYGGRRVQTRYFNVGDQAWLGQNLVAARDLVAQAVAQDGIAIETLANGTILLRNASTEKVLRFLHGYSFHSSSFDLDPDVISRYIESQNEEGFLLTWNIALMGGTPEDSVEPFEFGPNLRVRKIRRAKLSDGPLEYADIKTLMSKEDRVVDISDIDPASARGQTEASLAAARQRRDPGLIALYAIDKESPPNPQNRRTRVPLNALEDVMGVGLVFPGTGGERAVEYVSADLSRLGMTPDEVEEPDDEDPESEGTSQSQVPVP